jgi:bile acid:Na+ symporter, BASS family
LIPLAALALAKMLRLDEPLGVDLLLLGAAAGAPFLPKLAQIAKGNLAFAVGLMVLLMVVTVGYLPLVLPALLPGVSVNPAKIARSLFLLMLLPLAGALAVNAQSPTAAACAKPVLNQASCAFSGLTLPPYWILTPSAVARSKVETRTDRINA